MLQRCLVRKETHSGRLELLGALVLPLVEPYGALVRLAVGLIRAPAPLPVDRLERWRFSQTNWSECW